MTIPSRQKSSCIHTYPRLLPYACVQWAPHKPSCSDLITDPRDGMITDPTTDIGGRTTTSRQAKGAIARTKAMNWSKRLSPKLRSL
jgi:hypothetical protein